MVKRALAAAALVLGACDQFTAVKGAPVAPYPRPIVVMHRGGGWGNPDYPENTLPAIVYGASLYDGAEMDLQLGADGTIWLGHDNEVRDCSDPAVGPTGGEVIGCFQELSDAAIEAVSWCDWETAVPCVEGSTPACRQHYVTLADVFERFTTDPTLLEKVLALDVKDQLCDLNRIAAEAKTMANSLDDLVDRHGLGARLVVESDQPTFMRQYRERGTPADLYVEGYGGVDPIIETAGREGADGISYRYTSAPFDPTFPEGLRNVGLRVMVWPVPQPVEDPTDIPLVWAMNPDVIATDRSDFFLYVTLPTPQ